MGAGDKIMSDARLSIRIDAETKAKAEDVFRKIGLTMSSGITIFLTKVAAEKAIPFPLSAAREKELGETAWKFEQAAVHSVRNALAQKRFDDVPIARYDAKKKRPYLEYPDGRKDYGIGK